LLVLPPSKLWEIGSLHNQQKANNPPVIKLHPGMMATVPQSYSRGDGKKQQIAKLRWLRITMNHG